MLFFWTLFIKETLKKIDSAVFNIIIIIIIIIFWAATTAVISAPASVKLIDDTWFRFSPSPTRPHPHRDHPNWFPDVDSSLRECLYICFVLVSPADQEDEMKPWECFGRLLCSARRPSPSWSARGVSISCALLLLLPPSASPPLSISSLSFGGAMWKRY